MCLCVFESVRVIHVHVCVYVLTSHRYECGDWKFPLLVSTVFFEIDFLHWLWNSLVKSSAQWVSESFCVWSWNVHGRAWLFMWVLEILAQYSTHWALSLAPHICFYCLFYFPPSLLSCLATSGYLWLAWSSLCSFVTCSMRYSGGSVGTRTICGW